MPIRVPRLTTRRMMIAVAIVASLFWCTNMGIRAVGNHRRATVHRAVSRMLRGRVATLTGQIAAAKAAGASPAELEATLVESHKELDEEERATAFYEERIWQPWKSLPPGDQPTFLTWGVSSTSSTTVIGPSPRSDP